MEELIAVGISPLVGRTAELAALRAATGESRLVTVTGTGGVGKTRLALAAVEESADTTVLVELAALSDPDLLAATVLAAAGPPTESRVDPLEALVAVLSSGARRLLIDNCEHLHEPVARLCGVLLRRAPELRILATSRTPLGVPGEVTFELAPLSSEDAASLFVDRARRASRGFAADRVELETIRRLCDELDGLPLAIELAAARTRMVDVGQIAADIERRLDLIAGGPASPPRHRSLRASIEWSCELLSESERALFERVSVFAGGWQFEAAEAVCSGEQVARADVLDLLGALVDRSLVVVDRSGGAPRFAMLVTVRAYAQERLAARGAESDRVHAAHVEWCLAVVESAERELMGSGQPAALGLLDRESDNIRAAIAWARDHDPALGLRVASASALYWHARGRFAEGRRVLESLLPATRGASAEVRARVFWALGLMLISSGELGDARSVVDDAVLSARETGEPGLVARALNLLAEFDLMSDPVAAERPLAEAVTLARRARDAWCLADALGKLGAAALYRSDAGAARGPLEECLGIARRAGDERAMHRALGGLARVTALEGDADAAIAVLREGMALAERLGDRSWLSLDLAMLGELQRFAGRAGEGRAPAERGLALAEEIDAGYPRYIATGVIGRIALALGDLDNADERFTTAVGMAREGGWRPFAAWWHLGLADVALARGDADGVTTHARAALAVAQTIGNRRDEARAVGALGLAALLRSECDLALAELSTALTVQRDIGDEQGARRTLEALCEALATSGQDERSARIQTALARGSDGFAEAVGIALRGRGSRARAMEAGLGGLTQAEAEVARLAASGASNPEIAGRLFMSRSTVKTHLSRVYAKLGVANRTELAGALASLRQSG